MDLFLSSQSVGLAAVVTAGCMVAAGATSNRWAGWWSQRRDRKRETIEHPDEPTEELPVSGRHHVAIAGRLRIEGPGCERLEDAAAAAASSYYLHHEGQAQAWSARAQCLYLEVKGARVRLEGAILVDVGSEEHFPGVGLLSLGRHVVDRVRAAEPIALSTRRDVPPCGVFRSLVDGDEVVVTGWLEPDDGAATLCPAEGETLVASCRRRPTVRGPLGRVAVWAAAFLVGA